MAGVRIVSAAEVDYAASPRAFSSRCSRRAKPCVDPDPGRDRLRDRLRDSP